MKTTTGRKTKAARKMRALAAEKPVALEDPREVFLDLYEVSFHAFPGIRWINDKSGRVIWVSSNYLAMTGLTPEMVLHHTVSEVFGPEIGTELEALDQRAREDGIETFTENMAVPLGRHLVWRQWVTPIAHGAVLCSAMPIA